MSIHCEACGKKTYKRFSCEHCGYVWSPEGEVEELRARLAEIDRQVLWRTEDMPEDAAYWCKLWIDATGETQCQWRDWSGDPISKAPEITPELPPEDGALFLPILDPPEES